MKLVKAQNWEDVKDTVKICFSNDKKLINEFHIKAGSSLDACVDDTYTVLKQYTAFDFEFYKVVDGEVIGFVGIEPSIEHLTTFCLKNGFRTNENKDKLWQLINGLFENGFKCGLYLKNSRAINYLLKRGCTVKCESEYNGNPIVVLNYKKEVTCH